MPMTFGSKAHFAEGSFMESVVDYAVGTYLGIARASEIISNFVYSNTIRPVANQVLGLNLSLGTRPKVENGTIKVAAVGFGRTGTVRF